MADDLDDLVGFLGDRRPQVREQAFGIVQGLTGSPEGVERLKQRLPTLLPALFRAVPEQQESTSRVALVSLVNLAQDAAAAEALLALGAVGRAMGFIRDRTCPHTRLLMMLLANLTVTDAGCEQLLQLGQQELEGLYMAVLLKLFVTSAVTLGPGEDDPFEHVGALITNVTRLEAGRRLLLQPGRGLLQALASQLRGGSEVRRRGCAGALRNCCLSAEADGTLSHILEDEEVLTRLLVPLSGAAPVEVDGLVREALAESVQVLASSDEGRNVLLKLNAPELLRKGYELEEHPGVCAAMEAAARSFLLGTAVAEEDEQALALQPVEHTNGHAQPAEGDGRPTSVAAAAVGGTDKSGVSCNSACATHCASSAECS